MVAKRLKDAHVHHQKRHQRQQDEARLRRRTAGPPTLSKKGSKSKLQGGSSSNLVNSKRLSTDAAWRIRESVVRHHADPYVAVSALVKVVAPTPTKK